MHFCSWKRPSDSMSCWKQKTIPDVTLVSNLVTKRWPERKTEKKMFSQQKTCQIFCSMALGLESSVWLSVVQSVRPSLWFTPKYLNTLQTASRGWTLTTLLIIWPFFWDEIDICVKYISKCWTACYLRLHSRNTKNLSTVSICPIQEPTVSAVLCLLLINTF